MVYRDEITGKENNFTKNYFVELNLFDLQVDDLFDYKIRNN